MVIAVYGLIFFPDTPEKTTAFYLSKEERQRCIERLVEDDRIPVGEFHWNIFIRVVTSWQFYVLTILWCEYTILTSLGNLVCDTNSSLGFWETTVGKVGNTAFQLFLDYDSDHTWSVYQINTIPTAINGFNIIMVMLFNIYADATGQRMLMIVVNIVSICVKRSGHDLTGASVYFSSEPYAW